MLDDLLLALKNLSVEILPILGAVSLIFLCIFLKKLSVLIESITKTVEKLSPTIDLVDKSIEKIQPPLDTVVKLSNTIDGVHDKTVESVNKATAYVNENMSEIKSKINDKVSEVKNIFKKDEGTKYE